MKFYLIRPKEENSSIFIDAAYKKTRVRTSSGIVIPSKYWDENKQKVSNKYSVYLTINNRLSSIKGSIESFVSELKLKGINISNDDFKKQIQHIINPNKESFYYTTDAEEENKLLYQYIKFIDYQKSLQNKKPKTIKKYEFIRKMIEQFESYRGKPIYFNELSSTLYEQMYSYLANTKSMRDSSIESIYNGIICVINHCNEKKLITFSNISEAKPKKPKKRESNKAALTEEEVQKLKNYEPEKKLEKVKDVFLFQIETMLRHSDLNNISPENIDWVNKELKIWQLKTSTYLRIPLSNNSISILKKYKSFPKISNSDYNYAVKKLCKAAGIDENIEVVEFINNKRISKILPKYKLVSSHTARRTGITLLLLRGIAPDIVMKISGHSTLSAFQKYVRITQKTAVEAVRNAWEE